MLSALGIGKNWNLKLGIMLIGIMAGISSCKSHKPTCYSTMPVDTNKLVEPTCYKMIMDTNIVEPPPPLDNLPNSNEQ